MLLQSLFPLMFQLLSPLLSTYLPEVGLCCTLTQEMTRGLTLELVAYNPHTATFGYMCAKLAWQDSGTIAMSLVTQVRPS